jgi:triphosphatase
MRLAVSRFSSAIALTLDHGKIDTGGRSAPLCEIELELERGDRAELLEVARDLTRTLRAHVALKSKAERGYDLLEDTLGAPAKAAPIAIVSGTRQLPFLRSSGHLQREVRRECR